MRHRFAILFIVIGLLAGVWVPAISAQENPKGVEVVIVLDTSGALLDRIDALCAGLTKDITALQARGFDFGVSIYGIAKPYACATQTVTQLPNSTVGNDSDWGAAITDVAAQHVWRSNTVRVIIPFSNRGPALGDPVNDPGPDRDVIVRAIAAAQANKIIVSPVVGASDKATQPDDRSRLEKLATDLATATGGRVEVLTDAQIDPTLAVFRVIGAAAGTGGGAPMLSIPGAVRTLTCQRDVIKCLSLNPAVILTNVFLAIVITVMLGLSQQLLTLSLALLRRAPAADQSTGEGGRLDKLKGGLTRAANASASTVTRSVRAFFAPESWSVGTPLIRSGVSIIMVVILIGLIALLAAFADPDFNPSTPRGVLIFLSLFGAIGLVGVTYSQLQIGAARRQGWQVARRIRPLSLIIMLLGVALSRAIGFLPGFLIAVPAGYALITAPEGQALNERRSASERRIVSVGLIGAIGLAVLAWLIAIPVDLAIGGILSQVANSAASQTSTLGLNALGIIQSALLTVYVIALLLSVSVLLPYSVAAGHRLFEGGWLAWTVGFAVLSFAALQTIFNPAQSGFEVFGNASVLSIGAGLAVVSGVALSVWLSANDRTLERDAKANSRLLLTALMLLGGWLLTCGCAGVAFVTRTVNWGNVLAVLIVVTVLAVGGYVAIKIRARG
ncbi:MAG: hypothetical protein HY870_21230 [Chloroflexi bacterium]|nr:hypothetical protein [Chloroflexota bacterium]